MASSIKRKVALKGQSRSKFCGEPTGRSKTSAPCLRLSGHKGKHRPTTFRRGNEPSSPVVAVAEVAADGTIGALVEDEGQPVVAVEPKAPARKTTKRRRAAKRLTKAQAATLAQAVEDGTVTPSAALSRVAASQRGKRNRPVRVA